jgi:hypothetical protein
LGYGDKDYRIILKWIRRTGSGDITGLNCLHLQASLVTFMWIRICNKTYWKAHMRGYVSYQLRGYVASNELRAGEEKASICDDDDDDDDDVA